MLIHLHMGTRMHTAQLAAASGLPCFDLNDGSSGYIAATEALASEHLNEVLAYDIENFLDTHDAEAALMAIVNAAFESYAAGLAAGITDFYLLHNLTGARAVWAILAGVTCWGSDEATLRVRKATLRALWRAVVFTHASRNRPKVNADPEDTLYPQECRPWSEITEWALASVRVGGVNGVGGVSRWSVSRWSVSRWRVSRWSTSRWSTSRWSASRWSTSRWSVSSWCVNGVGGVNAGGV